jgi:hypothetical protein
MATSVPIYQPVVTMPASAISPTPIFLPYAAHIHTGDIVYFATGTFAKGFYLLGGKFVAGDTITYNINGTGPIVLTGFLNTFQALQALVASINFFTATNLVTAYLDGNLVIIRANTGGVAGNAITITIATTSVTGEVAASDATLVGGSALGPLNSIVPAPVNLAAGIVGIAQAGSDEGWAGNPAIGKQYPWSVFGETQVGSSLTPPQPGYVPVLTLGPPALVVGNLLPTTGWQQGGTSQATYGTPVGINIDPVTGFYVFDPTSTNLVAVVQDIDNTVNSALVGMFGGSYSTNPTGLLSARVRVVFNAAALAIVQGG